MHSYNETLSAEDQEIERRALERSGATVEAMNAQFALISNLDKKAAREIKKRDRELGRRHARLQAMQQSEFKRKLAQLRRKL